MKKNLILVITLLTLIIFSFAGCRNYQFGTNSGTASNGKNFNSQVSGVVSGVVSGGKTFGNQVSGVVSGITSSMKP